jgi:nucleoside 2-deoxyribosyltransferase
MVQYLTWKETEHSPLLTITLMYDSRLTALGLDETNNAIAAKLWDKPLGWIWCINNTWFLDLDLLKERFVQLRGEIWLRGIVSIPPQYSSTEPIEIGFDDSSDFENFRDIYTNLVFLCVSPKNTILRQVFRPKPIEIKESLQAFLADHPNPRSNAFIMMRFDSGKPNKAICKTIRQILKSSGIEGLRADDKIYHDDLYWNIMTYIYGCGLGIAVFERVESDTFNPNVSLEVGYMLALGKPVCLLKDQTIKALHADLIGKLYQPFDVYDPSGSIPLVLDQWLRNKEFKQN